jgi:hypothetical protein
VVGAGWNSDGEGGDRATLMLSPNQSKYVHFYLNRMESYLECNVAALADAIFGLNMPVVLVLEGGRPFAIPDYYSQAAAVLNTVIYFFSIIKL